MMLFRGYSLFSYDGMTIALSCKLRLMTKKLKLSVCHRLKDQLYNRIPMSVHYLRNLSDDCHFIMKRLTLFPEHHHYMCCKK